MMFSFRAACVVMFAVSLSANSAHADVRLSKLFADGMVLQRDAGVPIYGWADEGEAVAVTIGDQTVSTVAKGGTWRVDLKPLQAGGPVEVKIAGNSTVILKDVLIGDVWVSCGQSNMMMELGSIDGGPELIKASDNFPKIRTFNVTGEPADAPVKEMAGGNWASANPNNLGGFSAVSYVFGRALHEKLQVPIGLINIVAIVPAEAWVDRTSLDADPFLAAVAKSPLGGGRSYNGMIAPVQPFAVKGVIYYQGEYNGGRGREYRRLFPALIQSWRKTWGQPELPFFFVQLAAFGEHKAQADKKLDMPAAALAALHQPGGASGWAEVREAQLMTMQSVPKTGMAVAIDAGDAQDIHPKNKRPIGERLALAARAVAYGEKLEYSGPIFDKLTAKGGAVELRFAHIGKGLVAKDGALQGFELGKSDGSYVFANAEIRGETIVVTSPDAPQPVAVRYAWADYPRCNLYNGDGLPASPFRAFIPETAHAANSFEIAFKNPSFETAGKSGAAGPDGWEIGKGAKRTEENASVGKTSLRIPVGGEAAQNGIVSPYITRYDWNSDPLEHVNFRPGYAFGYSLDIAAGPGAPGPVKAYLRLCAHSTAEAYQYWGGVPEITTNGDKFVTRHVASNMTSNFDMRGGGAGVGILLAFLPSETNKGEILLDNLSPVTILRPMLAISDTAPIDLGAVAPGAKATSKPRTLSNSQKRTVADHRTDASPDVSQVATVLYGVANLKPAVHGDAEHVRGDTDNVVAGIIGKDASKFAFVTTHAGATSQELKLIGADEKPGLRGGAAPESEALSIQFLGAAEAGTYSATVRIVTQAANVGTRSTGRSGEPPEAMYYVDIPITVHVGG